MTLWNIAQCVTGLAAVVWGFVCGVDGVGLGLVMIGALVFVESSGRIVRDVARQRMP